MRITVLFCLAFLYFSNGNVSAQTSSQSNASASPLHIGSKMPVVTLGAALNSKENKQVTLPTDKYIILDFWATWCTPCIGMIPKMNILQQRFKDRLLFISLSNESNGKVDSLLKKIKKAGTVADLIYVVNYNKILRSYFPHTTVPHYVWIDNKGTITAITGHEEITEVNLQRFLDDKPLSLPVKSDIVSKAEKNRNAWIHDMLNNHYGNDSIASLLYHSMLTGFINGHISSTSGTSYDYTAFKDRRLTAYNVSIISLYRMAFWFGKGGKDDYPSNRIIYDITDTIKYDRTGNPYKDTSKLYCFDLIIPEANRELLYKAMQRDLEMNFSLRGKIEKRLTNCLSLVVIDSTKLKTAGDDPQLRYSLFSIKMANKSMPDLMYALKWFNGGEYNLVPVIVDETGWTRRFDIEISAKLNDYPAVKSKLNDYGLDLVPTKRMRDVLVLSDRGHDSSSPL